MSATADLGTAANPIQAINTVHLIYVMNNCRLLALLESFGPIPTIPKGRVQLQ